MNGIVMTKRSEIIYLGEELIVRNAFTMGTESYDIVVKCSGIRKLGVNVPEDLAARIKGIWQDVNRYFVASNGVLDEFTWNGNKTFANGEEITIGNKDNINDSMKQLHKLIAGLMYQGVPLLRKTASVTASAQPSVSNSAAAPSVSIGISPVPESPKATPKSKRSKSKPRGSSGDIPISPKSRPKSPVKRESSTAPRTAGAAVHLDDAADLSFSLAMAHFSGRMISDRDVFFDSLVEPLRALTKTSAGSRRDNPVVQFLNLLAAEIKKTLPDNRKHLYKSLAVSCFCKNAAECLSKVGSSEADLLIAYQPFAI